MKEKTESGSFNTANKRRSRELATVIYSVPFPLSELGGKSAGTRRKVDALKRLTGDLLVFSPNRRSPILGAFQIAGNEIRTVWALLRKRSSIDIFFSRSIAGVLSIPVARALGVKVARELHADAIEEAAILANGRLKLIILTLTARLSHKLDRWADVRIFNHPALARWYDEHGWGSPADFICYNGGKKPGRNTTPDQNTATRIRIGADQYRYVLCFCGSMAPWHGIESLVDLQSTFDRHADEIRIVCAGGRIPSQIDPKGALLNISPADENECEVIAQCADLCLLPVKNIRRSPGSPLKLFDYLLMGAPIATQRNTEGYSDVINDYDAGFTTDFNDSEMARTDILEFLNQGPNTAGLRQSRNLPEITWDARMRYWLDRILG